MASFKKALILNYRSFESWRSAFVGTLTQQKVIGHLLPYVGVCRRGTRGTAAGLRKVVLSSVITKGARTFLL